jgi:hypothetical protein
LINEVGAEHDAGLGLQLFNNFLQVRRIHPPQAALFGDRFAKKHVALRLALTLALKLALRSVDAGRSSGRS